MTLVSNEQPDAREGGAAESATLDVFIVGDSVGTEQRTPVSRGAAGIDGEEIGETL